MGQITKMVKSTTDVDVCPRDIAPSCPFGVSIAGLWGVEGYLTYKKTPPPRTLQETYAYGPSAVLGGGAVSYERGTPVGFRATPINHANNTK